MTSIKSDLREAMLKIGSRAGRATNKTIKISASSTTYTAPANGFIYFSGETPGGSWSSLSAAVGSFIRNGFSSDSHGWSAWALPVKKGDVVALKKEGSSTFATLYFTYALGGGSLLIVVFAGGSNEY